MEYLTLIVLFGTVSLVLLTFEILVNTGDPSQEGARTLTGYACLGIALVLTAFALLVSIRIGSTPPPNRPNDRPEEIKKELAELEEWIKKLQTPSDAVADGRDGLSRANEAIGMMLSYNYRGILRLYRSSLQLEKLTKYVIFLTVALVLKTGLEFLHTPPTIWDWLIVITWIGGASLVTGWVTKSPS